MHSICTILNRYHWSREFSSEITNHREGWVHLSLTERKDQKDDWCFWRAEVKGEDGVRWSWGNGSVCWVTAGSNQSPERLYICLENYEMLTIEIWARSNLNSFILLALLWEEEWLTEHQLDHGCFLAMRWQRDGNGKAEKSCTGIYKGDWCD